MSNRLDIAIIGTGPAGLSAAINCKIRNKSFKIFGQPDFSEKIRKAHLIQNYLGLPSVTGEDLVKQFQAHLDQMEIEITDNHIKNIYAMGDYFSLVGINENFEAKAVILATGMGKQTLLSGEKEFLGKGVSYCATCDAFFYRNKIVSLIAYHKREELEANFLADVCEKVYYIPMYKENVQVDARIEVVKDVPLSIVGSEKVEKLVLKNTEIINDGVFILRESIPPTQLVTGIEMCENHIKVTRKMETNISGLFAAGDIVGLPYQYIKSAGEGNVASLSAVTYVDCLERK